MGVFILGRDPSPTHVMAQLAEDAIFQSYTFGEQNMKRAQQVEGKHRLKPGQFILNQPEEIREVLKRLTSADCMKIRYSPDSALF